VKTIAQKILAKQERAVQIKDRLTEIKTLAETDDDYELSADEITEVDTLSDEMEAVNKSIEGLQKIETTIASKAQPVKKGMFPRGDKSTKDEGSPLVKVATAKLIAHHTGDHYSDILERCYGHDDRIKAVSQFMAKTATDAATTTDAGWAAELVRDDLQSFMDDLADVSVYAALRAIGLPLNFGGANSLTIPRRNPARGAKNDLSGAFVGEGGVIPVKQMLIGSQTLNRFKVGVISAFTNEILEQSVEALESIVRQTMLDDTAERLDGILLGNTALVPGIQPAGLLHGVTAVASVGGTAANIITDLKVLFKAMTDANVGARPALIMNSNRLLGLSTVTTAAGGFMFKNDIAAGHLLGVPIVSSTNVPAAEVTIVDAASFVSANDNPEFKVSDQATLTMANSDHTAPTQADDGTGALGTAEQVPPRGGIDVAGDGAGGAAAAGYTAQSMFQTYSTALRMVMPTSWAMVRPNAVAALKTVDW